MKVSRIMSRKEYESYLAGKTIRPLSNKWAKTGDSDVRAFQWLKDGAIFFAPEDIRDYFKADVCCYFAMLYSRVFVPKSRRGDMICVFEINRKYLSFGTARARGALHSEAMYECYASCYNRKNAKLLYVSDLCEWEERVCWSHTCDGETADHCPSRRD